MKKKDSAEQQRLREDLLRPSHYFGYDHDTIGIYTLNRGVYRIAESQFRRAIWLNPFEPIFKVHLAWCLYKLHNLQEAKEWALKALKQDSENKEALELLAKIESQLE